MLVILIKNQPHINTDSLVSTYFENVYCKCQLSQRSALGCILFGRVSKGEIKTRDSNVLNRDNPGDSLTTFLRDNFRFEYKFAQFCPLCVQIAK